MANAALAVVPDTNAAAIIAATGFRREQIELIKQTVAVGATDMELALFLDTAHRRGLDPMTRQIHFIKRKNRRVNPVSGSWEDVMVGTIQTGIDGFRLIAERTGKSEGQDDAEFEYLDPAKRDFPLKATVRVWKKGVPRPYVGTAFFREYAQTTSNGELTSMWKNKPHVMLAKVAEALALRKAFPEDLSGVYTDDEMPAIEAEVIASSTSEAGRPTGTVTRIPDRMQAAAVPIAEEIPPPDADAATLRAWVGKRLAIARKSWTGEDMAAVCGEVTSVLGLETGVVTPRTLGEHLGAYRNAIANGTSAPVAEPAAEVQPAAQPPAEPEAEAEAVVDEAHVVAWRAIADYVAENLSGNADEDPAWFQDLVAEASAADGAVVYNWQDLKSAGLVRLLELIKALPEAAK